MPFQLCCLQHTSYPWPHSLHVWRSLWLWHLSSLIISSAIQASVPQLHTMTSQCLLSSRGLHAGSAQPHIEGLNSMAFLSHGGRLDKPSARVSFTTLNPDPRGQHCQIWQLAWPRAWPLESHLQNATMLHLFMRELNSDSHAHNWPTEVFFQPGWYWCLHINFLKLYWIVYSFR